jgi:peptidoglycan/LPS O-acetylase OafA/YrhL
MSVHAIAFFAPAELENRHLEYLAEAIVFFFAMSGFLIYLPFVRTYAAGERRPDLRRYATQRAFRVYPGYLVIFLLANFVLAAVYLRNAAVVAVDGTDDGTGRITDPGRVLVHLSLVQNLLPSQLQTGIAPSWSLTTELCFYLLLPLLVLVFLHRRRGAPRVLNALGPAITMAVLGLAGKAVTHAVQVQSYPRVGVYRAEFGPNPVAVLARSIVVLADNFAYGMAAAVLFVWFERGRLRRISPRLLAWTCPPVILFTVYAALVANARGSRLTGTFLAIASGTLIVLVTEPTARGRRSWMPRVLDVRPLKFVGTISLSVYLWHYPVILVLTRLGLHGEDTTAGMLGSLAAVGAASLALGAVTYRWVEAPAMRYAGRRTARFVHRDPEPVASLGDP